ncbi:cellulose binding domain-containing protein [Micromonospora sp. LOL_024]|uniref:cellulose binding domain-containing protein n=1 Tax=Micromonospora sp. LOL_024 TaxID=3345412 RepID=UPI003A8836DA
MAGSNAAHPLRIDSVDRRLLGAEGTVQAGTAAISGWTVNWTWPNGQSITSSWNATITSSGSSVSAPNAGYNGSLSANGTTNFGFNASWNGSNSTPTLRRQVTAPAAGVARTSAAPASSRVAACPAYSTHNRHPVPRHPHQGAHHTAGSTHWSPASALAGDESDEGVVGAALAGAGLSVAMRRKGTPFPFPFVQRPVRPPICSRRMWAGPAGRTVPTRRGHLMCVRPRPVLRPPEFWVPATRHVV